MYFRSERRHYNLFHPLRDLQMSWTDLFTFGNFWNHLQYEMTSHLEFMKLNNFTIFSIFYLPILTFNSTMDSTLVCVWKCILEYCISLVISYYLLSLVNADLFYANFTITTFQKEPRYMYLMPIPSLTHT